MYIIIDKKSTDFYNQPAYVSQDNNTDIVLFINFARKFRSKENAQNFINKTFTDTSNYDIIWEKI